MSTDPTSSAPALPPPPTRTRVRRFWWSFGLATIGAVAVIAIIAFGGRLLNGKNASPNKSAGPTVVEVVLPKRGGIDRVCVQPGTVEPYESADLYAKVSGYLLETKDIGERVKKGDVVVRLFVPEYEKQVQKDAAAVEHSKAKQTQMEAHLIVAQAEAQAAKQLIKQVEVELKSKSAYLSFRTNSLERIKKLYRDNAVDAVVLDQEQDHYEAAFQAEIERREAVMTATLKAAAAQAKVAQAEADIVDAKAEVKVANAEWERAKVLLAYAIIRSPYDGVVTKRNFHASSKSGGDFIRSADAGGDRSPVVAVDGTKWMRIVVQVPDRDVRFVDVDDKATITIDALPGRSWEGTVARFAESEDAQTRTMRTEIDVENTDGKLQRNMYGRVRIILEAGSPKLLRIASGAVVKRGNPAKHFVRVMRDHRVQFVPVDIGQDTGVEVEILRGLQPTDEVIVRAKGPIDEGSEVTTEVPTEVETDDDD